MPKGNPVKIPEPGCGFDGNVSKPRDAGASPGKSFLFFLTVGKTLESDCLEIAVLQQTEPHLLVLSGALATARENLGARASRLVVPITAAGLQGEQPLVDRRM